MDNMIKIFNQTDKTFTSNGDVVIDPIKAIVHQKDNAISYRECATKALFHLTRKECA